jgi:branched-chain amino acid transport system substrate-binding protein
MVFGLARQVHELGRPRVRSYYKGDTMNRRNWLALTALAASALTAPLAFGQAKDIKIAHVHSVTGPLEAYGKQTTTGLMMGFEYATNGTMAVNGHKIVVIEKDDQGKPDIGKSLLQAAYADDKVDLAVGPTSSGVALAMLPVAAEYKKILLVEPAVADSITGDKWNRYIFRTGRSSSQDAIANAVTIDQPGTEVATLAQDYAFGRDGVKALKDALKKAKVVHEEYLPQNTTDFTAGFQRIVDAMKNKPGRKVIFVIWAGANPPFAKLADLDLKKRYGIEVATGGNILPAMVPYNNFPGMEGASYYYFGFSKNQANLWLVTNHFTRYKSPPDFFTAGGFSAAMAIVTALKKTGGDTNTDKLISAMEGMTFDTPKGPMTFRKQDHQAMQSMYHFRVSAGAHPGAMPDLTLVKEIKASDMDVPIRNGRK